MTESFKNEVQKNACTAPTSETEQLLGACQSDASQHNHVRHPIFSDIILIFGVLVFLVLIPIFCRFRCSGHVGVFPENTEAFLTVHTGNALASLGTRCVNSLPTSRAPAAASVLTSRTCPEAHFHLKFKTPLFFHHEMDGDTLNFGFKAFLVNATSISFLFGLSPFFKGGFY